ncbi:MAG: endonuclease III [Chloroflexi bacterium]|nr:MAG: endonuclease III [Chloroflexota bacterium]
MIITPPAHLTRIYERLIDTYGEPENDPDYDPLGGLVGTILSQHTSDINSERAFGQLVATFPTWEAVRDAPTYQLAEAIRSGGLANIKAPRIQDALFTLTEQQHAQGSSKPLAEYLSNELTKRTPEEAWRYLRGIPGVGPKTAACVLMFNMGRAIMPIDTHVHRVSQRLGLIGPKVTADQAHEIFAKSTPPEWVYGLHVNLIRHGRQVCHAQRPECSHCTLYEQCVYVGSVNAQESLLSSETLSTHRQEDGSV